MTKSPLEYAQSAQELCVLPDIYSKLTDMLSKDDCSLDALAEVIELEPAIASTLLKMANSAMFQFPREIDSIPRALLLIGLKEVSNLVNAYGVTAAFSEIDPSVADMDKFWEISVDCALICEFLAKEKNVPDTNAIFLSGLFHNLGALAMVHNAPKEIKYCEEYTSDDTPWQRQKETFGFTYADCSAALLKLWQIPYTIIEPIREFNHAPTESVSPAAQLLFVASRLAIINSHPGMYSKKSFIDAQVLDSLDITADDIDSALEHCNVKALELLAAFPIY